MNNLIITLYVKNSSLGESGHELIDILVKEWQKQPLLKDVFPGRICIDYRVFKPTWWTRLKLWLGFSSFEERYFIRYNYD